MQHEQWASVQIEQPNFVAKKGVWALTCCYVTAFGAILTIGLLGPKTLLHKTYRDVDYDVMRVRGSSIEYNEETGDALWKLNLRKLEPDNQFIHVNARLQRPGWNDGPKSARNIDFSFRQEYTLFSEMGTGEHFLKQHSDAVGNHSHHHKVVCLAKKRFCEPFMVYHKDYLATSAIHLKVMFWRPEFYFDGGQKANSIHQVSNEMFLEREYEQLQQAEQCVDRDDLIASHATEGQPTTCEDVLEVLGKEQACAQYACATCPYSGVCDKSCGFCPTGEGGGGGGGAGVVPPHGKQWQQQYGHLLQNFHDKPTPESSPPQEKGGKSKSSSFRGLKQNSTEEEEEEEEEEAPSDDASVVEDVGKDEIDDAAAEGAEEEDWENFYEAGEVGDDEEEWEELYGEGGGYGEFDDFSWDDDFYLWGGYYYDDIFYGKEEEDDDGSGGGLSTWLEHWGEQAPTPMPNVSPQPTPEPTFDFFNFHEDAAWTLLLETVTVNKDYTRFELTLRYTFLALTLLVFGGYLKSMRQLSSQMWGYQQKWVTALLAVLILFDGPLTALRIYTVNDVNLQEHHSPDEHDRTHASKAVRHAVSSNKQASRILTDVCIFCTTIFVATIMVYFLAILEEMGSGGVWKFFGCDLCLNRWTSNSMKLLVVGSFWAVTYAAYLTQAHERERDPGFTLFDKDESRFAPWVAVIGTLLGAYLLWLVVLLVDAVRAMRSLTPPFRFIAAITLVTIAVVLVGPFFGAYYSIPKSAPAFAVIFGLVNVYVYVLAFSYLPRLEDFAVSGEEDDDIGMELAGIKGQGGDEDDDVGDGGFGSYSVTGDENDNEEEA